MVEVVLFALAAAVTLGGALGVIVARNPVHAALNLVAVLVAVAVFFVMQQAPLLAAVQVIVYASAVVVLFLFVIMLLGVDRRESLAEPLRHQRPLALAVAVALSLEVLVLAGHTWTTGASGQQGTISGGAVEVLAENVFTRYLWPFEVLAVLLVVAVVGGVTLARHSGEPAGADDVDEERAAPEPGEVPGP
jgi:NADH-quinone oxidoreductase subunit J